MASTIQPVTFYVPVSSAEPTELNVQHSGLRMVLVSRESIHLLDESWRVLGIYFLIGPSEEVDRYRAYVGEVGRATLVQRARHHAKEKPWWSRALLIARDSRDGFNSAEIGWLEGRLYDVLNNAVACDVMNGNRPGDESLPPRERALLERYVEPIVAALRACGAPPDTADQKPPRRGRRKVTRYSESVNDLLEAKLLKAGTLLRPLKKGVTGQARVLEDGSLEVAEEVFTSLSAAAKAVAGSVAEAGWDFWGAPSGTGTYVPLATLRERLRENGASDKPEGSAAAAANARRRRDSRMSSDVKSARRAGSQDLAALVKRAGLSLPLDLHATYRKQRAEARIEDDGSVSFSGPAFGVAVRSRRLDPLSITLCDELPIRSVEDSFGLVAGVPVPNADPIECIPELDPLFWRRRELITLNDLVATAKLPDQTLAVGLDAVVPVKPAADRRLEPLRDRAKRPA